MIHPKEIDTSELKAIKGHYQALKRERDELRAQRDELITLLRLYLVPYPQTLDRAELNRMARGLLWKIARSALARIKAHA